MKNFLSSLFFVVALCFSSFARSAEIYKIDPNHCFINWRVSHFGFSNPSGKFIGSEGLISIDEKYPELSSVEVNIPINSLSTGLKKFDEHLFGPDFFDLEKYPIAKFSSKKVELLKKNRARVYGDLILRGVKAPIVLDVILNKIAVNQFSQKKTAGFSASTKFKRSIFGMNFGLPGIGDEVKIDIEIEGFVESQPSK